MIEDEIAWDAFLDEIKYDSELGVGKRYLSSIYQFIIVLSFD